MAVGSSNNHPGVMEAHTPTAVRLRLAAPASHSYLRDFVYGAVDGTVTTFAIVSGVAGARLPARVVLVLGIANVVADGFSMAVGNFLATRAERQLAERARRTEERHVEDVPDGEREEVRQIYARKGFAGDDLERVVEVITADRGRWVDTMLQEELGLAKLAPAPSRAALMTFAAFLTAGVVPLLPFVYALVLAEQRTNSFAWSAAITAVVFFTIGVIKGRLVGQPWYRGGLEVLAVGGGAAGLAYLLGLLLRDVGATG